MKQTSFKDIQHLYLGCKCKCEKGTMIYTLSSIDRKGMALFSDSFGNEMWLSPDKWKPLLRKLDSMTEEERGEFYSLNNTHHNKEQCEARNTFYLLSKHFDLFNLIESGEALDINEIKNK